MNPVYYLLSRLCLCIGIIGCSYSGMLAQDCPIVSDYRFIDLHKSVDSCSHKYKYRVAHPMSLDTFHHLGYRVISIRSFGDRFDRVKEKLYDEVALDLNYWSDLSEFDWSRLHRLEYLKIRSITEVPKEVFQLSNLKVLCIHAARLEVIPDEIENLRNLEVLHIEIALKIKELNPRIFSLSNLRELRLNSFERIAPTVVDLSKMKNLRKLDLWNCRNVEIDSSLLNCQQLRYLEVSKYNPCIAELPNLETLGLGPVHREEEIDNIHRAAKLKELSIGGYGIPHIAKSISEIPKLEKMMINYIGESDINRTRLQFDHLAYLSITSMDLNELPDHDLPKLRYLHLVDHKNSNHKSSARILKQYQNLEYLRLIVGDNSTGLDLAEDEEVGFRILGL